RGAVGSVCIRTRALRSGVDDDRTRREHSRARRAPRGAATGTRHREAGTSRMTTLATLQASFQRHVLGHEERFSDRIATPPAGSAEERIAIYRDAYRIRLREALASNYARLESLLGEAAFAEIADAYIEAQPSTFRSIRWFGDALPALLEAALPAKPWLAELAQWEWAIAAAFDAA